MRIVPSANREIARTRVSQFIFQAHPEKSNEIVSSCWSRDCAKIPVDRECRYEGSDRAQNCRRNVDARERLAQRYFRKFRESTMLRDDKSSGGSSSKRPWNFRLTIQNGHKRGHPEAPGGREASRAENALVEGEARWRILQGEQIYIRRKYRGRTQFTFNLI